MNTRKGNRSRLADVLADIKKHGDDNDVTPTPPKRRSTATNNIETKTSLGAPRPPTYVLKLFDRPIQFTGDESRENTPLYPLCRAWVRGQPLRKRTDPAEPTETPQTDNTGESGDVYCLPIPKSITETMKQFNIQSSNDDLDIRIPKYVRDFERSENIEETIDKSIGMMSHTDCLALNKVRWREVKKSWKEARRIHESRYDESLKTLQDLCMTFNRDPK